MWGRGGRSIGIERVRGKYGSGWRIGGDEVVWYGSGCGEGGFFAVV